VAGVPDQSEAAEHLVNLPEAGRLNNFADLDQQANFADVRVAWNEFGLAIQAEVKGKHEPPSGDAARPWSSDGLMFWIDTRDARSSHRASRYCHQFHFLPVGGGSERDEPVVLPMKINRAAQDAPLPDEDAIGFRVHRRKDGYRLEVFLPATVLQGFDPEQHPRLGFHYLVRDQEKGEQTLSVESGDFPVAEDPSLWSTLELVKETVTRSGAGLPRDDE